MQTQGAVHPQPKDRTPALPRGAGALVETGMVSLLHLSGFVMADRNVLLSGGRIGLRESRLLSEAEMKDKTEWKCRMGYTSEHILRHISVHT